jgi:hypothetical protein
MKISSGKISAPVRAVFYGPEGIGKSTFGTWAPKPLFIDVERGTRHLEVDRIDDINGWEHIESAVTDLTKDHHGYQTLVIDTIDWAEKLATEYLCSIHNKDGIEGFGYGKGFIYVKELFDRLLGKLDALVDSGMHVMILAHSISRKHEDPGRAGSYDRYELKLSRHVSPLIKEWADLLVFMNYKTVITEGDRGNIVAGGKERLLYTTHTAAYDAKNRHELDDILPMEWDAIAPAFSYKRDAAAKPKPKKVQAKPKPEPQFAPVQPLEEEEEEDDIPFDPLTEESTPEPATEVQINNCKNLWLRCVEDLGHKPEQLTKLWQFYKIDGPAGMWSKLTKPQAADVIGFLSSKLEG